MTKKVIVEWTLTDDYGRHDTTGEWKWFDTEKDAREWTDMMEKKNGGYFYLFRTFEADYDKWLEIKKLREEIREIEKKVTALYEELEVR